MIICNLQIDMESLSQLGASDLKLSFNIPLGIGAKLINEVKKRQGIKRVSF